VNLQSAYSPIDIRSGVLACESDGFTCISRRNRVIGENKPPRADYIDGLRAVAILSVMMYHLNKNWFPGGFVGVDIFCHIWIRGFHVCESFGKCRIHKFRKSFLRQAHGKNIAGTNFLSAHNFFRCDAIYSSCLVVRVHQKSRSWCVFGCFEFFINGEHW